MRSVISFFCPQTSKLHWTLEPPSSRVFSLTWELHLHSPGFWVFRRRLNHSLHGYTLVLGPEQNMLWGLWASIAIPTLFPQQIFFWVLNTSCQSCFSGEHWLGHSFFVFGLSSRAESSRIFSTPQHKLTPYRVRCTSLHRWPHVSPATS